MGCLTVDIRRFGELHIAVGVVCARDIGDVMRIVDSGEVRICSDGSVRITARKKY